MFHAAVRLAPLLVGATLVMAACSPACATHDARASGGGSPDSNAPDGFVAMEVMGVLPTSEGNAVFLVNEPEQVVLPIWIGGSEALSIQLRLERRRFERPLTHDLLDSAVRELGGHVIKVHVDDLRGATFVGTVFVLRGGESMRLDARPSDAIALAVGNRVPIFVARAVVERAGLSKDEMEAGSLAPPTDPEEAPALDDPQAPLLPPDESPSGGLRDDIGPPEDEPTILQPPLVREL